MEDKLEKKLKAFLPYIIIIGAVYLFLPVLLVIFDRNNTYLGWHSLMFIGVFSLTALGCCFHYSYKKENDLMLSLVAPIFFLPSALLYGLFRDSVINTLIYLAAYFVCGYLGLLLGDMFSDKQSKAKETQREEREPAPRRPSRRTPSRRPAPSSRPRRVEVEKDAPRHFLTEDPYEDKSLDTSTTDDDIDAILNEIHSRRNND